MGRLPFNPDRLPRPKSDGAGRGGRPMTVSEAAGIIRQALADASGAKLRVVGQVSNFSERSHWFFSLKDEQATLRCVCFASVARKINVAMTDGMEVVVSGRLDFYDAQGHVQLYVDKVEPVGEGVLELQFRKLCEQLRELGYFDPQTKMPLAATPRRIAIVTSRSGAALQDVIDTARQRWGGCELLLYDVRVQGESAGGEIAEAVKALSRCGRYLQIDAILLTRGGGSMEDLWAFNERIVADAIYTCTLPVVAAIGHETDTTIAELVADVRCATPTQAVMHLIPDAAALGQQVEQIAHRLALLMRRQLQHGSSRLDAVSRNRLFGRPGALIEAAGQQTNRLADVLERAMHQRMHTVGSMLAEFRHQLARLEPGSRIRLGRRQVGDADGRLTRVLRVLVGQKGVLLDALTRQLDGVGPRSVLGRGYSYTLDRDNQLIGSIKQVRPGQGIVTVVSDGRFRSTIDPSPAHRSRKTGHRAPQSQPSLFDHESP